MFKQILIAFICAFLLIGCVSKKEIEYSTTAIERQELDVPAPQKLELDDVVFVTVTEDNFKQVMDDMKAKGMEPVLFALTQDGIQVMLLNQTKIKNFVEQKNLQTEQYKKYYEDNKPPIKDDPRTR